MDRDENRKLPAEPKRGEPDNPKDIRRMPGVDRGGGRQQGGDRQELERPGAGDPAGGAGRNTVRRVDDD